MPTSRFFAILKADSPIHSEINSKNAMLKTQDAYFRTCMTAIAVLALCGFLTPAGPAAAASVADSVRGKILLDVEQNGEAWYVTVMPAERHYLGRPDDAFAIMRDLGLGISDADLAKIPAKDDAFAGDATLRDRVAGRILLQVEAHGEAWYVDPADRKRYYLGRPADAFAIMRELGLGITSADLAGIPVALSDPKSVANDVAFASQAPLGNWSDRREQEGCEEASAYMAVKWARRETFSLAEAERFIQDVSDWEKATYGHYEDTSAQDTADRIIKGYLKYGAVETKQEIGVDDVYRALAEGGVVVLPVNGRLLPNPYFTSPGPIRHMILVIGYDAATDQFIVNESGTRHGAGFRYARTDLASALMDYPTGYHETIVPGKTAMVVVKAE
uniref:Peptidase C39-like family protein n=1 Tax=uncultured bacterium pA1 TaxID=1776268 RepID=A0A0U3UF28_9BACT|nr:peptidase C39-like family protein [uncultured bacterium pA1]